MTMNWTTLGEATYKNQRWDLLGKVEETGVPKLRPYLDSASPANPTIGVGFNLKEQSSLEAVLKSIGFSYVDDIANPGRKIPAPGEAPYVTRILSELGKSYPNTTTGRDLLRSNLNAVMVDRFADPAVPAANRTHSSFEFLNDGEISSAFDEIIQSYETSVETWLPSIPAFSRERLALVSLAYNGKPAAMDNPATPWNDRAVSSLLGLGLYNALQTGDRAEAWYEIRYNSNKNSTAATPPADAPGIAKRRYYESEVFGLYDEGGSTPAQLDAEAKSVLQMYTRHREQIEAYEKFYGLWDGVRGSRTDTRGFTAIEAADFDFGLSGTAQIDTVTQALDSARNRLIAAEVTAHGITRTIDGEVLIGQDLDYVTPKQTYSKDDTTTLVGTDKNDLILGGAGDDRLDGGLGDDVLIGGAGVDTYVVQGHDILIDSGRNLIQYNGALIAGVFTGDGSGSTFTDDKGNTLVFHSPGNLTLGATDSITFQNQTGSAAFAGHDFGLFLREPSLAPATTATQVGDSGNNNLSGTAVNDLIVGNGGRDLLQGESGDDVLFADAQITLPAGPGYGGATPYADAVGDFVNGGVGADTLIGGALSDALVGAEGDDLRLAA